MPGVVAEHVTFKSKIFGVDFVSNVLMPSGNLGVSERRSQFTIMPKEGAYVAHLSRTAHLREKGATVAQHNIKVGRADFGPFSTREEALHLVSGYISDYQGAARQHRQAGIEHHNREMAKERNT